MPTKAVLVSFCMFNVVVAQLNGEFWWLNDKVKQYNGGNVPAAKFENLSDFDNDENDKLVYSNDVDVDDKDSVKDELAFNAESGEENNSKKNEKLLSEIDDEAKDKIGGHIKVNESKNGTFKLHFPGLDNIVWPRDFDILQTNDKEVNITNKLNKENTVKNDNANDEFRFNFPDTTFKYTTNSTIKSSPMVQSKPNSVLRDQITFKAYTNTDSEKKNSENICTYIKEEECNQRDGFVYKQKKRSTKLEMKYISSSSICCILPVKPEQKSYKFVFPETNHENSFRFPRSTKHEDLNTALNQRKALLIKRYLSYTGNLKPTIQPQVTQRIVTLDDEYEDPYANIKNHNFQTQRPRPYPSYTKPNYGIDAYDDDYIDEFPKPGLGGIYSAIAPRPSSWTFTNDQFEDDVGDEEFEAGYGVISANPRLDHLKPTSTANPSKRKPPSKQTTTSSEESKYADAATIHYQSNPDFQVLEGFKLLNLVRNKSRYYKNSRKSTTESITDGSPETVVIDAEDDIYDDFGNTGNQVFKACGRAAKDQSINERLTGEARPSSNPWLVLVVRSRRQKTTLCHATLVHPRAAVSAATCVYGAAPGEIIIHAGVFDMRDENQRVQQRMATTHVHPRYNHPGLANDLAVLHWNRPLRLNTNVQPICLSEANSQSHWDSCYFAGWGGKGQAIHTKPKWQRATIVDSRECSSCFFDHRGERLPKGAFCASTETQGCVTGIGGALVCSSNGKKTAVGIVIWRENCDVTSTVVLLPIQDWIHRALTGLGII